MDDEKVVYASAAPGSDLASVFPIQNPRLSIPPTQKSHVIHIGNPAIEKPHLDLSRCERFRTSFPDMRVIFVVWEEKDREFLTANLDPKLYDVVLWKEDSEVMVWLLDNIGKIVGAEINQPKWWECPEKHATMFLREEDPNAVKCKTCGNAVQMTFPVYDKFMEFAVLFQRIAALANFDTRSGDFLHSVVSPMGNLIKNMPYALGCGVDGCGCTRTVQAKDLRGAHKDIPVIICGAGPSLEDAIPHLRRLQDRVKILCVGRTYKLLRSHEIRVDYVVECEMFDWDSIIFDGLSAKDVGDAVLCYADVCAPETVKKWPGRKCCMWNVESGKVLGREDTILGGNSVAHHMLNFAAQMLLADPIIMVGIDLGYSKPKAHADGTTPDGWPKEIRDKEEAYQAEDWGLSTGKGNLHPDCHRTPVAHVPGGGGGRGGAFAISKIIEVRTSPSYKNFRDLFVVLIQKHKKKVWNACPNGLKIENAPYLDLETWIPPKPGV